MRETRADKAQALLLALALHVLLFGLMFVGLLWTRTPPPIGYGGGHEPRGSAGSVHRTPIMEQA